MVVVGLGVLGEALSKGPARGWLALAGFAPKLFFSKRIFVVVVVVVVGLGVLGRSLILFLTMCLYTSSMQFAAIINHGGRLKAHCMIAISIQLSRGMDISPSRLCDVLIVVLLR